MIFEGVNDTELIVPSIYPNPMKDFCTAFLPSQQEGNEVVLLDGNAKHIRTYKYSIQNGIQIKREQLPAATYYLKYQIGSNVFLEKVVMD